jgi:hypothetical protein
VQNPVETQRPRTSWSPLVPVPEDAPRARISHPQRGEPARIFQYRDTEGRLLGYVCRFFKSKGGVATMPLTFCRNAEDKSTAWRWQAFPKLRPIYGAERLDRGDPEDGLGPTKIALVVADELTVEELSPREGGPGWRETEIDGPLGKLKAPTHPFIATTWFHGRAGATRSARWIGRLFAAVICAIWMPHSAERHKVAKGDPGAGGFLPIERQPWRVTRAGSWKRSENSARCRSRSSRPRRSRSCPTVESDCAR